MCNILRTIQPSSRISTFQHLLAWNPEQKKLKLICGSDHKLSAVAQKLMHFPFENWIFWIKKQLSEFSHFHISLPILMNSDKKQAYVQMKI